MEKLIKGLPVKEYDKQWHLNNPEKGKVARKKYRLSHKKQENERQRGYRLKKKLEKQNNKTKEL